MSLTLLRSLSWLELDQLRMFMNAVTHQRDLQSLALRTKEQREFEQFVKKYFYQSSKSKLITSLMVNIFVIDLLILLEFALKTDECLSSSKPDKTAIFTNIEQLKQDLDPMKEGSGKKM